MDRGDDETLSLAAAAAATVWTCSRSKRSTKPISRARPPPSFAPRTTAVVPTPPRLISVVAVTSYEGARGRRTANLQEKGRMSLKDGKKGTETNERIAVGSGEGRGGRQGSEGGGRHEVVEARGRGALSFSHSISLSLRGGKEGGRGGVRPVGRYFCACFVFNFSPPFARRGADAAPRLAAPRLAAPCRAATPGRGAVALVGVRLS